VSTTGNNKGNSWGGSSDLLGGGGGASYNFQKTVQQKENINFDNTKSSHLFLELAIISII